MRYAKLSAPDRGAVAADQASGRRPAADPASAGLGSAGPGSGSAGQDSGSDCSFQFSFFASQGVTPSAKRGCARVAREHPVPLGFARRQPCRDFGGWNLRAGNKLCASGPWLIRRSCRPGFRTVRQCHSASIEAAWGPPTRHLKSMIRKDGHRCSLATNAERVCAEIMLKQQTEARFKDSS